MYKQRITNNRIQELKPDEIFVFGSNLAGAHGGGAALLTYRKWGAVWGKVLVYRGKRMLCLRCMAVWIKSILM